MTDTTNTTNDKRVRDCIEASNEAAEQGESMYDRGEIEFLVQMGQRFEKDAGATITPRQQAWLRELYDKAVNSPY